MRYSLSRAGDGGGLLGTGEEAGPSRFGCPDALVPANGKLANDTTILHASWRSASLRLVRPGGGTVLRCHGSPAFAECRQLLNLNPDWPGAASWWVRRRCAPSDTWYCTASACPWQTCDCRWGVTSVLPRRHMGSGKCWQAGPPRHSPPLHGPHTRVRHSLFSRPVFRARGRLARGGARPKNCIIT